VLAEHPEGVQQILADLPRIEKPGQHCGLSLIRGGEAASSESLSLSRFRHSGNERRSIGSPGVVRSNPGVRPVVDAVARKHPIVGI